MSAHVELQATCAALGYLEKDVYYKEDDCLVAIKDLIRFLKREDDSCDIRRQLGTFQIIQNDLIPIIKQYSEDKTLLDTVIRLLVNLTQPAVLCFQGVVPEERGMRTQFLEVQTQLAQYKQAFCDEGFFSVLTSKLGQLLELDWENRQEEDRMLIERILLVLRNLLHVPTDIKSEQRTDDDANLHDQLLWTMHTTGMEDLLLYLASSESERQFAFHVLEIISLMFREQTAEQLAKAGETRSISEQEKDKRELAVIREQENAKKKVELRKQNPRHSRFGGTYVLSNTKSISDRDVIYHRSLTRVDNINYDHAKVPKKRAKNRRIIIDTELTRKSTLSIRLVLKQFCAQFVESCYNPLMNAVKSALIRSSAQENDETYYMWAMRFFMEFQRHYNFKVELISETLSVPTFHYIQTQLQTYHDMRMTNKKEGILWSKRAHLALRAYLELLNCLSSLDKSRDKKLRASSKVIKGNVFYMIEYRELFITLLKNFNETQQSRSYLKDLIEATHLFMKLLEGMTKSSSHMMVQKKAKKKQKKQKSIPVPMENNNTALSQTELEELWDNLSGDLSGMIQGRTEITPEGEVVPFDAAAETGIDDQKIDAMHRIQRFLHQQQPSDAIALMRAAREVWPEGDQFGEAGISPEEEFMALRQVFFADMPGSQPAPDLVTEEHHDQVEEESDEEMEIPQMDEGEFEMLEFVRRFAHPSSLRCYVMLLGNFSANSAHTNHCIIKMLHRVAMDLGLIGMVMQISLFRVFQKVMVDPMVKTKQYDEILVFAKHVLRKYFSIAKDNSSAYMELFFWKNNRESFELVSGYGTHDPKNKSIKNLWTEEQELELKGLWDECKDMQVEGLDIIDHIMSRLIDDTKTRRMVIRQLAHMEIISGAKDIKKHKLGRFAWLEEHTEELKKLYEEYKDSNDLMADILSGLSIKCSKHKVLQKMIELGLIENARQVKGVRMRKSGGRGEEGGRRKAGGGTSCWENTGRADDFIDTTDDSSSDDDNTGGQPKMLPYTERQTHKYLKTVLEKKQEAAVAWIKNNLSEAADDKEEDSDDEESVPIVPVTSEQEDAMEDEQFKLLLRSLGITAPTEAQHQFWRIPGSLTPAQLRDRSKALTCIEFPDDMSEPEELNVPRKPSKVAELNEKMKNKRIQKERSRNNRFAESSDSDDDGDLDSFFKRNKPDSPPPHRVTPKNRSKSRLKAIRDDSSDSEGSRSNSPTMSHTSEEAPVLNEGSSSAQKRQMDSESSDSDDNKLLIDMSPTRRASQPKKRVRVASSEDGDGSDGDSTSNGSGADSDVENVPPPSSTEQDLNTFPATMLSQEQSDSSDSDIDDHVPLIRASKRAAVIDSDSE